MENRTVHLSKPLYELLPYVYLVAGLAAIVCAYFLLQEIVADIVLVLGVVCLLGGVIVLLKRRDARARRYQGGALDVAGENVGETVADKDKAQVP
jgi:uncharacterized membrane protein HdeD (DUF308 family)